MPQVGDLGYIGMGGRFYEYDEPYTGITESGVAWTDYGDYLSDILEAGYDMSGDPSKVPVAVLGEYLQKAEATLERDALKYIPVEAVTSDYVLLEELDLLGDADLFEYKGQMYDPSDLPIVAGVVPPITAGGLSTVLGVIGAGFMIADALDDTWGFFQGDEKESQEAYYELQGGETKMADNNGLVIPGTDIVLQGPGNKEPYPGYIAKEWAGIGGSRFYLLINGRVVVRRKNGTWKLIRRPKMLHMKVSNPRMGDVVKADKIVSRVAKVLRKRLKK